VSSDNGFEDFDEVVGAVLEGTFSADSLDDLLHAGLGAVLDRGTVIVPTKGECKELFGIRLELMRPRARLSRSEARGLRIFSGLGELLWYLRGTNDVEVISYYLPRYRSYEDEGKVYGGYGPRLLNFDGVNQLRGMVEVLTRKPASRQAVIQLFDHIDIVEPHSDVPCTCVLQFLLRNEQLHTLVYMRSNDIYIGFPHDVFCFTMIQELIASALQVELGKYIHFAGSFHLYKREYEVAKRFMREGYFSTIEMPAMPQGDPWPAVASLLEIEAALRSGNDPSSVKIDGNTYWDDLARLLVLFALGKQRRVAEMQAVRDRMGVSVYDTLIMDKISSGNG
jgi:thymidylate synthase